MSSLVKNRAGTWELYYRCMPGCDAHPEGGTRHHVSLGTRDTKVAHQLQEEFDAEQDLLVARLKLGLATLKPKASLTLSALWKQYAEAMAHEKSPYTLSDADWPAINHLIMHVGDIQASQLTLPTVLQYRAKFLTVLKLAPATWNSRRKILRAIWNWAIRMKFLTTNPFSEVNDVVDHEDDHRLQPVPTHQLRALLTMAPSRFWQLIILFLYQTMCRRGELINLLRTDVLWNEDLIRFRRPKERRGSQVRHKYISLTPRTEADNSRSSTVI
ncbi:MAG: hypothetical protein OJF52_001169 [Nitrospira sp.]|jgi:integrase|nr:MAG: hypothetical protein OJF52_001169 [Nitrospira sp.]